MENKKKTRTIKKPFRMGSIVVANCPRCGSGHVKVDYEEELECKCCHHQWRDHADNN
jgi:hypothetical protein